MCLARGHQLHLGCLQLGCNARQAPSLVVLLAVRLGVLLQPVDEGLGGLAHLQSVGQDRSGGQQAEPGMHLKSGQHRLHLVVRISTPGHHS